MDIEVGKVVVGDHNPRKIFDEKKLTKLKESIETHGLIEPIVVSAVRPDGFYDLIAGERRLKAHVMGDIPTIPAVVKDFNPTFKEDLVLKLIENIQREDLNPMEEAYAIEQLKTKTSLNKPGSIAKQLGKSKVFVERRLAILEADKKVQKALMEGKITIGHALVLCRLSKKIQKSLLNEILSDGGCTVSNLIKKIKWHGDIPSLSDYPFDKKECDGCKHNGGQQTVLYETGSELKELCMNQKCLIRKTNEWLKGKKKELIEQGATITTLKDIEENHKQAAEIFHWNRDDALEDLKKHPGNYLVVLDPTEDPDDLITVFSTGGKHFNKIERSTNTGTPDTRLIGKIQAWKRQFLIRYNKKSLEESPVMTKKLTAYFQIEEASYTDQKKLLTEMKVYSDGYPSMSKVLKKLLKMDEAELDRILLYESQIRMKGIWSDRTLEDIAKYQGMKLKKDFIITESYLKLHTIDQLLDLAKELKIELGKGKKTEMIKVFLKAELKGKIPTKFKTKLI